jgi:hypothetical protein
MILDDSDDGQSEPVSPCFAKKDGADSKLLLVNGAIEIEI